MRFTPKTPEQIAKEKLLPKGEYDVECVGGEDGMSKAGNDMFVLTLKIHGERAVTIKEYIVSSAEDKVNNACSAFGILDKFHDQNGKEVEVHGGDFYGRWARALIDIQPGKDGFPPKNVVKKYIVKKTDKVAATKAGIESFEQERKRLAGDEVDSPF